MSALTVAGTVASAALLVTATGLVFVRTAPALARWFALVTGVGCAVVALLADRTDLREVPPRVPAPVSLGAGVEERTALLAAAARAGPRAVELRAHWTPRVAAGRPPVAALGATITAPPALPFAPSDVTLRAVGELVAR